MDGTKAKNTMTEESIKKKRVTMRSANQKSEEATRNQKGCLKKGQTIVRHARKNQYMIPTFWSSFGQLSTARKQKIAITLGKLNGMD